MTGRCVICGWPMAKDQEGGCVPGDCSSRPQDPAEQSKLRERRQLVARVTLAVQAAWSSRGEVPFPLYESEARAIACEAISAYETR